jgi:hypothetical protein
MESNKPKLSEPLEKGSHSGNEEDVRPPVLHVVTDNKNETDISRGEEKEDITDDSAGVAENASASPEATADNLKKLVFGGAETNFTWAHFFHHHCGILQDDSLKYEKNLIAHRLSPEDTLLESIGLIIEFGRMPIGDKLKLVKTIKRQEGSLKMANKQKKDAAKLLGLEGYNEFEAGAILSVACGDSECHIEYSVDQYEHLKILLEQETALASLKNANFGEAYSAGVVCGARARDPAIQLLHSFGYRSFDYTKGKSLDESLPQTRALSRDPMVQDLIFGNLDSTGSNDVEDRRASSMAMYS